MLKTLPAPKSSFPRIVNWSKVLITTISYLDNALKLEYKYILKKMNLPLSTNIHYRPVSRKVRKENWH